MKIGRKVAFFLSAFVLIQDEDFLSVVVRVLECLANFTLRVRSLLSFALLGGNEPEINKSNVAVIAAKSTQSYLFLANAPNAKRIVNKFFGIQFNSRKRCLEFRIVIK